MHTVTSKDGTTIAFERLGRGPRLILVDGALCHRKFGPMPKLAPLLADHFDVIYYDRRGRGASGEAAPYAVAREVEDLAALLAVENDPAFVYGTSSGAALALRAAGAGLPICGLVLHEPPFALDGTHQPQPPDFPQQIRSLTESGQLSAALSLFLRVVGVPRAALLLMRCIPGLWRKLKASAATLPHDFEVLGDTQAGGPLPVEFQDILERLHIPLLLLVGSKSPNWMHHTALRLTQPVRGAQVQVLPGQDHNVAAQAVAPLLRSFFAP